MIYWLFFYLTPSELSHYANRCQIQFKGIQKYFKRKKLTNDYVLLLIINLVWKQIPGHTFFFKLLIIDLYKGSY